MEQYIYQLMIKEKNKEGDDESLVFQIIGYFSTKDKAKRAYTEIQKKYPELKHTRCRVKALKLDEVLEEYKLR